MIQFVRIDHRLLHGQVLYSWLKSIVCDTILIANDSVAVSESKRMVCDWQSPQIRSSL